MWKRSRKLYIICMTIADFSSYFLHFDNIKTQILINKFSMNRKNIFAWEEKMIKIKMICASAFLDAIVRCHTLNVGEQSRRFEENGKSPKRHGSRSSQRRTKFNVALTSPLLGEFTCVNTQRARLAFMALTWIRYADRKYTAAAAVHFQRRKPASGFLHISLCEYPATRCT